MSRHARELYLASLDSNVELSARRLAEQSGIPDNDPMWLLLHEMQRAMREAAGGVNAVLANDAFADRVSSAIGINVANDERVVAALTAAIKNTREAAMHAIRSLEVALHDVARRRAAAPFASLMFAFALGLTACCAVIWSAYHAGTDYGSDLGYRAGYNDGIINERHRK